MLDCSYAPTLTSLIILCSSSAYSKQFVRPVCDISLVSEFGYPYAFERFAGVALSDLTFFWHDYETWGVDPRRDRASQFAGIRTDKDLNIVDEPVMFYCQPTADFLPSPDSALITGITPQKAAQEGLIEAAFFQRIHAELARPGTCGVGYNSLRFDDEVTRFGFYRNYLDPYGREWQNGNSRWDILDLVRMTRALRPEGIEWPEHEDGRPSFKLEHLTAANDIEHIGAHDALSDVRATIGMAKLIKDTQPRLFEYYFDLRQKAKAADLINLNEHKVILHITGMFPSDLGCIAPVMPLMIHPTNKNEVIVYNLREDPTAMLNATPDEIIANLYTPNAERAEGDLRFGLKGVHVNKSPALAPTNTLTEERAETWQIDWAQVQQNRDQILADKDFFHRLKRVYSARREHAENDVDAALYDGFIPNPDRQLCDQVIASDAQTLSGWEPPFADARLKELFFRYRARNWPETLSHDEQVQWREFCRERLLEGQHGCTLTIDDFQLRIEQLGDEPLDEKQQGILRQLVRWVQEM